MVQEQTGSQLLGVVEQALLSFVSLCIYFGLSFSQQVAFIQMKKSLLVIQLQLGSPQLPLLERRRARRL
jgi:hypothetical protein